MPGPNPQAPCRSAATKALYASHYRVPVQQSLEAAWPAAQTRRLSLAERFNCCATWPPGRPRTGPDRHEPARSCASPMVRSWPDGGAAVQDRPVRAYPVLPSRLLRDRGPGTRLTWDGVPTTVRRALGASSRGWATRRPPALQHAWAGLPGSLAATCRTWKPGDTLPAPDRWPRPRRPPTRWRNRPARVLTGRTTSGSMWTASAPPTRYYGRGARRPCRALARRTVRHVRPVGPSRARRPGGNSCDLSAPSRPRGSSKTPRSVRVTAHPALHTSRPWCAPSAGRRSANALVC